MNYVPRYAQPFTLAECLALDISTIAEEISRLQNSLKHLLETQAALHGHLSEAQSDTVQLEPDIEIVQAIEENDVVIGSQKERITILQMALREKGIPASAHYDIPALNSTSASTTESDVASNSTSPLEAVDTDGGMHL